MQTFYNIVGKIKTLLEADDFVNTVTKGLRSDIDTQKQNVYPLSHVQINQSSPEGSVWRFNITTFHLDQLNISKNPETDLYIGNDDEDDIFNTQLAVFNRMYEQLRKGSDTATYQMDGNPTCIPVMGEFDQGLTGWECTFEILTPNVMTSCFGVLDLATPCEGEDGFAENSDVSYSLTVPSGTTQPIPDSAVNVNTVNEGSVVSVKAINVVTTQASAPYAPTTITVLSNTITLDFPAGGASITTATLMKTGQTISYRTGDDGDLEAGRATSFTVLAENNPFGNTNRFTDELGGATYTNNIVIDWSTYDGSTVLGWDRRTNGGGASTDKTWQDAIDEALAHSVGTFTTGWRLPNINENISASNYGTTSDSSVGFNYAPFSIPPGATTQFWIGTSIASGYAMYCAAYGVRNYSLYSASGGKRWLAVRTFTVTGTTLT